MSTLIRQVRAEPSFGFRDSYAFSGAVIFHLVPAYFPDTEVPRGGMRKVQAANGTCRNHCVIFGELDTGLLLGMEQIKQRPLFGVIGKRGIPGRRPYPTVSFIDEVPERRLFAASVAPILAGSFVEPLGKRFGQAVREGLCHDRTVIVVFFCESRRELVDPGSCGHDKGSDVVQHICRLWGDKVGQRLIELAGSLSKLLAERMKSGHYLFA